MRKTVFLDIIFVLFLSFNLFGAISISCPNIKPVDFTLEDIQVVTTIPVETTLAQEDTLPAHEVWLHMINNAKSSIDIGQFYLTNQDGERLQPIVESLINAARRGVKIRILTEISKTDVSKAVIDKFAGVPNVEVVFFNWKQLTRGIIHAKYFVFDKETVFVGSQNFDWKSITHIHETGLLIKSKAFAVALAYVFELDWRYSSGEKDIYNCAKQNEPFKFSPELFMVASPNEYSPNGVVSSIDVLIDLINSAKSKITVELLTYSLKKYGADDLFTKIDNALRSAAKRGVKIRMVLSDWCKRPSTLPYVQALSKVHNISIKLITIPQHSSGPIPYARVLHSKVMRIDDNLSWVGTSNWEYSYFYTSRNIEIVSRIKPIADKLDVLFEKLWSSEYSYPPE